MRQFLPFCVLATAMTVTAALAGPPELRLPIDCAPGRDCFIQNYVDHDPGPGRRDYACGRLGYNGDTGTDFRLRDYVALERGVSVLAAAAGTVVDVRDGMPDVSIRETGLEAVRGREAGNRVAIVHDDGWLTQYSHMKQGSIVVRKGDRVEAGQPLGQVGLSGRTEFPHVEMIVIHGNKPVDPFVGDVPFPDCAAPRRPLWAADTLARLPYRETALLGAGFAAEPPNPEAARRGAYAPPASDAGRLEFWVDIMGAQAGDEIDLRVTAPGGREVLRRRAKVDRDFALLFLSSGEARPASGWSAGAYRGVCTLIRHDKVVINDERMLTIPR